MQVRAALGEPAIGLLPRLSFHLGVLARHTVVAGERQHVRVNSRVDPAFATLHIGRIDGQPLPQREARRGRRVGQVGEKRPGPLGVHVVGRERGDTAPIVDSGPHQQIERSVDQIRRSLNPHARPEQQPSHRDGRREVDHLGVGNRAHRGVRLGSEVLDDDFLDVAVLAVRAADREERIDPLLERFADADEYPGRERHADPAGVFKNA